MLLLTSVLPTPALAAPVAVAAEQVRDAGGEVVVGVEQAGARRDDAVPVGVGVVGERDVEAVLELDQAGHRVRRGAVHADLAVPVDGHEREGRVDLVVDDRQVEPVALGDRPPSTRRSRRPAGRRPGAARWRGSRRGRRPRAGRRRRRRRSRGGAPSARRRPARTGRARRPSRPASSSSLASRSIHAVTSVSAGPPWGGLYLKPPSSGGLCDGVITMPSARARARRRGCGVRIACEITGVGV